MKDNNRITSIQNGRTLGSATPSKKDVPTAPQRIDEGKGLGKATPKKK